MPVDDLFLKDIRSLIERRIAELQAATDATVQSRATVELDQQSVGRLSRMDALQQQAMAKASDAMRAGEAQRLRHALRRLDTGDFGYCDDCGEEIGVDRLSRAPTATLCLDCARG